MLRYLHTAIFAGFLAISINAYAQTQSTTENRRVMLRLCVYEGDTIPWIQLRTVYIYKPLKLKNKKQRKAYDKLVRNVKKTLPIAKEINHIIIETYEYMETLPDEKARKKHIKAVEESLKEQYTPRMKKLTFSQGKLLIKLVDRECNQSSYELVKAFMGPFKASFYQTFASLFGASLKKEYDPENDDAMVERVVVLVENGQL
ncbi:MAG: DUF4294 domain-containing protein [Bacteroidaceae bacterium]|nr:DUF4294 domain-containing protein [Bacteroidaceae bacterium]MBQ8362280.1 DUF4294 domain-containing protein [Bacteroidaceae bacterium]